MVSNQNPSTGKGRRKKLTRKISNHACFMVVKLDNTMSTSADSRARQQMQSIRKELKDNTHFHDFEVERILHIYWKLTQNANMNLVEFQFFLFHVFGMTNSYMIRLMFSFLKEKKLTGGGAIIGPAQFVNILSIFCRGTLEEKINFAFKIYDQGVGVLSDETVMNYLRRTFYNKGIQDGFIEYEPREYFSYILQIFDPNDEKIITYKRFKETILEQPALLQAFGQIFPDRLAIYAFLTTFTHLVTTHHMKSIRQKDTEVKVEEPKVKEKKLTKMQMVPFSQEHLDEIFNEILEEVPAREEEKESEEEEAEDEEAKEKEAKEKEAKEVNILDDEDIDEYIYDEEDSDEDELLEDDEVESDEVEDEEEVIIEEEESEESDSLEELEIRESKKVREDAQDFIKEEGLGLGKVESSSTDEEYEDAAETIDLDREDILFDESSSTFECDIEEESSTEYESTEEEEEEEEDSSMCVEGESKVGEEVISEASSEQEEEPLPEEEMTSETKPVTPEGEKAPAIMAETESVLEDRKSEEEVIAVKSEEEKKSEEVEKTEEVVEKSVDVEKGEELDRKKDEEVVPEDNVQPEDEPEGE